MLRITIQGLLPSLNEYIDSERVNKHEAAKLKKRTEKDIGLQLGRVPRNRINKPCDFVFTWYRKDKKTDPDNISAAQKFVFDSLVKAEVLAGDGWGQVKSIHHDFKIGPERVEIEITEAIGNEKI